MQRHIYEWKLSYVKTIKRVMNYELSWKRLLLKVKEVEVLSWRNKILTNRVPSAVIVLFLCWNTRWPTATVEWKSDLSVPHVETYEVSAAIIGSIEDRAVLGRRLQVNPPNRPVHCESDTLTRAYRLINSPLYQKVLFVGISRESNTEYPQKDMRFCETWQAVIITVQACSLQQSLRRIVS
jgi:hypothetical protein